MRERNSLPEAQERVYRRYQEAREYGLSELEARLFSESEADVGLLRKLKAGGCPPGTAFKIMR